MKYNYAGDTYTQSVAANAIYGSNTGGTGTPINYMTDIVAACSSVQAS